MEPGLLKTKLYIPPLRPRLIARQGLIQHLKDGLEQGKKLTLISAPPGYGKTTLVSSWLRQLDRPAAWLSLDEGDNDGNRFILYVVAALQEVHSELGKTAVSLLGTPQPPGAQTLFTLLINDLTSWQGKLVLVLDDYHVIQMLGIHEAVEFLLNNQPPQLHLVIVSREDPPLPLHRLRGGGSMTGIYAHDLRFSSGEAAQFLNETMGLSLTPDQVATLEHRTEGWVAGLQLAALSMKDLPDHRGFVTSFASDDRYVSDYLIGEVFESQPEGIQEFLLKTAIFDRFCAPLCEAISRTGGRELGTGDQGFVGSCQAIIEELDRSNLFIVSLDNKREWYRYHHLFANFLRLRARGLPEEIVSELHLRASEWFETNGHLPESVEHALTAGNHERAARLIEGNAMATLWGRSGWSTLLNWIKALPYELVRARPQLSLQYAWALFTTGQWGSVDPVLDDVEAAISATGEDDTNKGLFAEVVTLRAWLAFETDEMVLCIDLAKRALELLPKDSLMVRSLGILAQGAAQFWLGQLRDSRQSLKEAVDTGLAAGNVAVALAAMGCQVQMEVMLGNLRKASGLYEKARQLGTIDGAALLSPVGYACVQMGEVLREWNRLGEAMDLLKEGVQLCRQAGVPEYAIESRMTLARVLLAAGDEAGAAEQMALGERELKDWFSDGGNIEFVITPALIHQVRYWLATGDITRTANWLVENGVLLVGDIPPEGETEYILLARVLIAKERFREARSLLKEILSRVKGGEGPRSTIETLVLLSISTEAHGERELALRSLRRALRLARPEGYLRIFIDEGDSLSGLLREVQGAGELADYVRTIRTAIQDERQRSIERELDVAGDPMPATPPTTRLEISKPLTEREIAILRLMAANLSNREIANELYLSINTIKWYSTIIYGKLGVNKRARAVACARELGII